MKEEIILNNNPYLYLNFRLIRYEIFKKYYKSSIKLEINFILFFDNFYSIISRIIYKLFYILLSNLFLNNYNIFM